MKTLAEIEKWIREGQAPLARQAITARANRPFAREERVQWAALARRSNLSLLSLKLLSPVVRPARGIPTNPTPAELTEYAAALLRVGAYNEAVALLNSVPGKDYPDAWLFRAFANFSQWEYGASIELLRSYLASPVLSDYWRQVGRVNLAAALVFEKKANEADSLLGELKRETQSQGNILLLGNVLELTAQNAISEKRWDEAKEYLESAERLVKRGEGLNSFFISKWNAILGLLDCGDETSLRRLAEVRKEALALQHWETVRDLDFFLAKATGNQALLLHLHFGSPFPAFRKRLSSEISKDLPSSYDWKLGPAGKSRATYDPLGKSLKPGTTLFRLFDVLSSDFYRPFRIPALHEKAFPGEYFNPYSGFNRMRKVLQRLRSELKSGKVGIQIEQHKGNYRLVAEKPVSLKVTRSEATRDPVVIFVDRLGERWRKSPFSAREAASQFGTSHRTANRLLSQAESRGLVEKTGQTRAIVYRVRRTTG